jgi:hypothetical protein
VKRGKAKRRTVTLRDLEDLARAIARFEAELTAVRFSAGNAINSMSREYGKLEGRHEIEVRGLQAEIARLRALVPPELAQLQCCPMCGLPRGSNERCDSCRRTREALAARAAARDAEIKRQRETISADLKQRCITCFEALGSNDACSVCVLSRDARAEQES